MAPRLPHFAAKAKRVIYLHMAGSPPHLDLLDYKPELVRRNGQDCPESFLRGRRFAFTSGVPKLLGTPQRFRGGMSLFVATVSEAKSPAEVWSAHVAGAINVHPVDCAHDNMMDPVPAEKIGAILASELGKQPTASQNRRRER